MKKFSAFLLAALLLLTGCGADKAETAPKTEPYTLEVETGDSGVPAERGSYRWNTADQEVETEVELPFDHLSEIPFVSESREKNMKLRFEQQPDSLEVRYWTSDDGYQQAASAACDKNKLPVPADDASYLYEVTATWEQGKKAPAWGSCTYYFRYLPQSTGADQSTETDFYRLVQLTPGDLFGVEFTNFLDGERKTCRSSSEVEAILTYLKEHLSTNFRVVEVPADAQADYGLRLAATDGTQFVFEYGGEGRDAWLRMDGTAYEAGVMDLYSVWQQLEAESVPLSEAWKEDYLQVCDTLPSEEWGQELTHGYLRSLDDKVVYDEILLEPVEAPAEEGQEGQEAAEPQLTLKRGTLGLELPLAEDCQFWLLKDHTGPWCQVPKKQLWLWSEDVSYDMLFTLYTREGQVIAICEEQKPQ